MAPSTGGGKVEGICSGGRGEGGCGIEEPSAVRMCVCRWMRDAGNVEMVEGGA